MARKPNKMTKDIQIEDNSKYNYSAMDADDSQSNKPKNKKLSKSKQEDILKEFRQAVEEWNLYFGANNKYYQDKTKFINGQQWDQLIVTKYQRDNRPCVTINKIFPKIMQKLGENNLNEAQVTMRKIGIKEDLDHRKIESEVANKVLPQPQGQPGVESVSDITKLVGIKPIVVVDPDIKAKEGLTRQLGFNQLAQEIYRKGGECSYKGGFGAWRIIVDYADDKKIFQTLKLAKIDDPTKAFWDVSAQESCKTDGKYAGFTTTMPIKEFKRKYPNIDPADFDEPYTPTGSFMWKGKDFITIGEFYRKEFFQDEIAENGSKMIYKSQFDSDEEFEQALVGEDWVRTTIENSRIMHYKCTGFNVIEYEETPFCNRLPVVFVDGASVWDGYQQLIRSFAHNAIEPQEQLNVTASEIQLWILLAKKSNVLVPAETVPEEMRDIWKNSGTNPPWALPFSGAESIKLGGLKPEQFSPVVIPPELTQQYNRLSQDIDEALGVFKANQGAEGNDTSAKHFAYRAIEGAAFAEVYRLNLKRAIEETGRIIVEALPKVFDEERMVTILNRNGQSEEIYINKRQFDFKEMDWSYNIDMKYLDRWELNIDVAPSIHVQDMIERQMILELMSRDPSGKTYALLAPIFAKTIQTPHAAEMEARLNFLVPPHILAAEQGKEYKEPPNPQAIASEQFMKLQMEKLQAEIMKNMAHMHNEKMDSIASQINALASLFRARNEEINTEIKKEIAEDTLSHRIIVDEANLQHQQNVLATELLNTVANTAEATNNPQQPMQQQSNSPQQQQMQPQNQL